MRESPGEVPTRLGAVLLASRVAQAVEVVAVFLVAAVVVTVGWSLVGSNALHRQAVVWVANVLMLSVLWIGLRLRGQSWANLGLSQRPGGLRALGRTMVQAVIVMVLALAAFVAGGIVMQTIATAGTAAAADTSGYDYLRGNLPALLIALAAVYVVSSFGEEVLYRGFLITRAEGFIGTGKATSTVAVVFSAVIFGLAHFDWGIVGVVQAMFMGVVFAVAYVVTKRNLWALVLAHACIDTLLLVQVYLGSAPP